LRRFHPLGGDRRRAPQRPNPRDRKVFRRRREGPPLPPFYSENLRRRRIDEVLASFRRSRAPTPGRRGPKSRPTVGSVLRKSHAVRTRRPPGRAREFTKRGFLNMAGSTSPGRGGHRSDPIKTRRSPEMANLQREGRWEDSADPGGSASAHGPLEAGIDFRRSPVMGMKSIALKPGKAGYPLADL
jgi:hypothetical protein